MSSELSALSSVWKKQSTRLREQQSEALNEFNKRLQRKWAIETGIIEGLYTIDRGITQTLIERGIEVSLIPHGSTDKPAEQVVAILRDHEEVIDGLFDFITNRRPLSAFYIKEIHQALTRNQHTAQGRDSHGRITEVPLIKGDWKKWPNNPTRSDGLVHEYCPPEQVVSEIDRLIALHLNHVQHRVSPEIEAAWLHHRFTQIHPFQDGNGRVVRALASLVLLRAGWFPLVIQREQREHYIDALEKADHGNLQPFVELIVKNEKRTFLDALSISENVLKEQKPVLQHVMVAAVDRLKTNIQEHQVAMFNLAETLQTLTIARFQQVADDLNTHLHPLKEEYSATVDDSTSRPSHWNMGQAIKVARSLHYYADIRSYHEWVRLQIVEERRVQLVILFHSFGHDFVGLMASSAFLEYADRDTDGVVIVDETYAVSEEIFQFSYQESEAIVTDRFQRWLNDILLVGLDSWRRQI